MKVSYRNLMLQLKFDGDLLIYKPGKLMPFQHPVEIPINIVLDYQYKSFASMARLILHINKYTFGQSKPNVKILKPIYMLAAPVKFEEALLTSLDEVIKGNMAGVNIGLKHIAANKIREFYELKSSYQEPTRWTHMKVTYTRHQEVDLTAWEKEYSLYRETRDIAS